jgi:hypothetical protein
MEKAALLRVLFKDHQTEVQGPIAEPASHIQGPITEPGPSLHAPKMSSLCCVIEDEDIVFPVDVPALARVSALKKEIQHERDMDTLQGVGPHTLELWKVSISQREVMGLSYHLFSPKT